MDADATNLTTMIATVVVALAAVAAIILNGFSGRHAKRSAEAAERAAEASRDAAAVTLAAVDVDFEISLGDVTPDAVMIAIVPKRASVWIHSVRLGSVLDDMGWQHRDQDCPMTGRDVPAFVHIGNHFSCRWPPPLPEGYTSAAVEVTYSFEAEGRKYAATRSASPVNIGSSQVDEAKDVE